MSDSLKGPHTDIVFTDAVQHNPEAFKAKKALRTLSTHIPEDEVSEVKVSVRLSKYKRCQELAEKIAADNFDWFTVGNTVVGIGVGSLFGAIVSGLPLTAVSGALYYCLFVSIAVFGCTLVWATRKFKKQSDAELAAEIRRLLPNTVSEEGQ